MSLFGQGFGKRYLSRKKFFSTIRFFQKKTPFRVNVLKSIFQKNDIIHKIKKIFAMENTFFEMKENNLFSEQLTLQNFLFLTFNPTVVKIFFFRKK